MDAIQRISSVLCPQGGAKEFTHGPMFAAMVFAFHPSCLCKQTTPLNTMVEDLAHNLVESVWKLALKNRGNAAILRQHMDKFVAAFDQWCKANAAFFTQHFMVRYMQCINNAQAHFGEKKTKWEARAAKQLTRVWQWGGDAYKNLANRWWEARMQREIPALQPSPVSIAALVQTLRVHRAEREANGTLPETPSINFVKAYPPLARSCRLVRSPVFLDQARTQARSSLLPSRRVATVMADVREHMLAHSTVAQAHRFDPHMHIEGYARCDWTALGQYMTFVYEWVKAQMQVDEDLDSYYTETLDRLRRAERRGPMDLADEIPDFLQVITALASKHRTHVVNSNLAVLAELDADDLEAFEAGTASVDRGRLRRWLGAAMEGVTTEGGPAWVVGTQKRFVESARAADARALAIFALVDLVMLPSRGAFPNVLHSSEDHLRLIRMQLPECSEDPGLHAKVQGALLAELLPGIAPPTFCNIMGFHLDRIRVSARLLGGGAGVI
jgi:hypothetical protein